MSDISVMIVPVIQIIIHIQIQNIYSVVTEVQENISSRLIYEY
tara:strand:- start:862 stop:990 length:129 start_codon:yes stop_codon:yes gene_type:complete